MALVLLDRAVQTTTTSGTTSLVTLAGTVLSYAPLYQAGRIAIDTDTFAYVMWHVNTALEEWEVGIGTLRSSSTFERISVSSSSNNNAPVDFTTGIKYVANDASAAVIQQALEGGGIASIGLTLPAEFSVTNSPLTADGVIEAAWASQAQNLVFASPNGSAGDPVFRALVAADIPALPYLTSVAWADLTSKAHNHEDAAGGGTLTTAAIASGTFADSFIPNLNASKINAGDLAIARIATALTTPGPIGGTTPSTGRFTQVGIGIAPVAGDMLSITPAAIANKGIHITAMTGQTGSLGYFQNVDDTARMEITSAMGISSRLASASSGVVQGRVYLDTQPRINVTANGDIILTDGTNAEDVRGSREGAGIYSFTFVPAAATGVTNVFRLKVNPTGVPVAGFGSAILTQLKSSATVNRSASLIETLWNVATDAAAEADHVFSAYHNAAGVLTKREGFRVRGGASSVQTSVNGKTPVTPPTYGAVSGTLNRGAFNSGTATTAEVAQAVAALITDLKAFGIAI